MGRVNVVDESVRLYPIADLARLWSVSKEYVYAEIRAGRLAAVEMGNGDRSKTRVSSADAARWIAEHRRGAA